MIKSTAAVYSAIATKWKNGGPPARPTPFELKKIFEPTIFWLAKNILKREKRAARILVLGATPEFRDLGLKYGMQVWVGDINPNMLQVMDQLMKYKKAKENKKIVADWLKISKHLPPHYFDLVIAEQSFNIVPLKDWPRLCQEIIKVLKSDGFILFKIATPTDKIKRKTVSWAIRAFSQNKIKAGDLAWILHFAPDAKLYNQKNGTVDLKGQPLIVDRALENGQITKKQWREHEKKIGAIQRGGIILHVLSKEKTTRFLKKYFKILKIKRGKDYRLCQDENIYWGKLSNK